MGQIHKRFTSEQVGFLFHAYLQGTVKRAEIEQVLGIRKTRFFALLKDYRRDPEGFTISYGRSVPPRLSSSTEALIKRELLREKELIDDPRLPISGYNYSALRDRLKKKEVSVSVPTIIRRAKALDCYIPHRRRQQPHSREVLTTAIGALVQHDASLHLWSPYAQEKWTLITSIDDFSRKLLFADFFPQETTWSHIQAAQALMQAYGIPLRYLRQLPTHLPLRPGPGQRLAQACPPDRRGRPPMETYDAGPGSRSDPRPLSSGQG